VIAADTAVIQQFYCFKVKFSVWLIAMQPACALTAMKEGRITFLRSHSWCSKLDLT